MAASVDGGRIVPVFQESMSLDDDGQYNIVLGEGRVDASTQT